MDIPRSSSRNKRRLGRALWVVSGLGAVLLLTIGAMRLKPAALGVDRSTLSIDTVKRGQMLRQVRGIGTLVPEQVRLIAASSEGRVERVHVQPGAEVSAGTVLVELVNPEIQQAVVDVEFQVVSAEADLNNLRARLNNERLSQQAGAATVHAEYQQAKIQFDTDDTLARAGFIPALSLKLARVRVEELANRYDLEQKRLVGNARSSQAQVESQQTRIKQLKAQLGLRRAQSNALRVLAGTAGVVQQVQVEVGQQITPGAVLARVAEQQHLKAELKIAETQAKDIQIGQKAEIDTRNGIIPGRVVRINPAAQQGTVTVDVALEGALPQGARPDLSIDGTVELERLDNILYVGRPTFGQTQSSVSMFKVEAGGKRAFKVIVKLGRSSVNTIEILDGLGEGDQVILSDTAQWDSVDNIDLN